MTIKEKIVGALDKIGHTNGHAVPPVQDPIVSDIHEYNVATIGESHFKARREKAKKKLEGHMSDLHKKELTKAIVNVKKNEQGETVSMFETEPYTVQVDLKNGASFLDVSLLKVTLMKKHKMKANEVEALIEDCTDRRDPSQSWKVVER